MTNHKMQDHGAHAGGQGAAGQSHVGHGDKPDLHGMLVVGEEAVFLSHLPMFDHPHHDYQVILKVAFTQPGGDPHAVYVNDRKTHPGTRMYTLVPQGFVLPDLLSSQAGGEPLRSFKGTIFRGHFERGGTPIIQDVEVNVLEVVHFREFEPLAYMLFGTAHEHFLAHLITKAPDFDQVLSVEVTGHEFSEEDLQRGVKVTFPGRVNTIEKRLTANEKVAGQSHVAGEAAPRIVDIQLEVGVEFYFEEGELRSPPVFMPTPEEQAAGF